MALSRSRRPDRTINYWPGFVDALSTLLLTVTFLLTVFVLGQYFQSREITGKDVVLERLKKQLSELTDILALERTTKAGLQNELSAVTATLDAARLESERLKGQGQDEAAATARAGALEQDVRTQRLAAQNAASQVEILNQQILALRRQLQALEEALNAKEAKERDDQEQIADLGSRLNVALAQRVQELNRYRSDFFGRLRQILGQRADIRVVGDRFVVQSELFFDTGTADLQPAGMVELDKVAAALIDLEHTIPPEIPWIVRIDGHTDKRPLTGAGPYRSNWELSAARAISVVRYLISKGVSPQRLAATGFGEYQPIDLGDTPEAYARNRRIELKVTER